MRYLVGFLCVCALVGTLPQSASAQTGEEGAAAEPNLVEEPAPSFEPASEEGGLSPRVRKRTLEQWDPHTYDRPSTSQGQARGPQAREPRVDPAAIGLGVSAVAFVGGLVMVGVAVNHSNFICVFECLPAPAWVAPVGTTGAVLALGGLAGTIASAVSLGRSRREERRRTSPGLDEEPPAHKNSLRGPKYRPH